MSLEGPKGNRICSKCEADGAWRCKDCFGRPQLCTECCRSSHTRSPFHRIESWSGEFFEDAWLFDVGLEMHLGHGGEACPVGVRNTFQDDPREEEDGIGEDEEVLPDEESPIEAKAFEDLGYQAGNEKRADRSLLIIIDRTGIHRLPVFWCRCDGHVPDDFQLLDIGLFPASFRRIKTAFTFHVLDDFLADNLECKTSAMHYYQKLRRFTSSSFPQSAPVGLCCTFEDDNLWNLGSLS